MQSSNYFLCNRCLDGLVLRTMDFVKTAHIRFVIIVNVFSFLIGIHFGKYLIFFPFRGLLCNCIWACRIMVEVILLVVCNQKIWPSLFMI
jgi:hypothetical protein